jgi:hypothetical protein
MIRYTWKDNEIVLRHSGNTYIGDMANKILNVSIKLKRPVTEKEMDLIIVPTISTVTGVVKK